MADHVPGEWFLAIDLSQPVSGLMVDEQRGVILVPFATQQSVHVAAGRLKLAIVPPAQMVQGEVIRDHEADPDRIQAIANATDYGVP
jgi:hypothetical protein